MSFVRSKPARGAFIALFGVLTVGLIVAVFLGHAANLETRATLASEKVAVAERARAAAKLAATRVVALDLYGDAETVLQVVPAELVDDPKVLVRLGELNAALYQASQLAIALGVTPDDPATVDPAGDDPAGDGRAGDGQLSVQALVAQKVAIERAMSEVEQALLDAAASAYSRDVLLPPRTPALERELFFSAHERLHSLDTPSRSVGHLLEYADAWSDLLVAREKLLAADAIASRTGVGCEAIEPTYIEGVLVVNKTYALPCDFGDGMTRETGAAFRAMADAASARGLKLTVFSGFRTYQEQKELFASFVASRGAAATERVAARAGHSEHQSGLAIDFNCGCSALATNREGKWVAANAHNYGFIVRFPPGKGHITGLDYEPWHLRFVGVELATVLHSQGLSLEEYFGIDSYYRG